MEKWKRVGRRNGNRSYFFLLLLTLLISPALGLSYDGVIISEANYRGLQALKHSLDDPRGLLKSWNDTGVGACSGVWAGIKCAKGHVIAIQLPWLGFGGQLTESIRQLTGLRRLSIHDNSIGGQIPSSIGFLPELRGLYLFNNRFSGAIPASIGNCHSLQTLDFSNNLLIGKIPPFLNSTKVYRLNLSYNSLSGDIPAGITRLPDIKFLSLEHNNLSGPIPDTWGGGSNISYQLQSLTLDHNSFFGTVPHSLGMLPMLQTVSLSNNQLSGSIPEEIGSLPVIQRLDLSGNLISGTIPESVSNLSSLVALELDNNLIGDQIPESFDGLQNLSVLSLKNNRFSGDIPASIGNISGLTKLDLSDNDLAGEIPTRLVNLSNLTFFNVSNNNLSGPVPLLLVEKFSSTSFRGNIQLCGFGPSVPCPSPNLPPPTRKQKHGGRRRLSTRDIILIAAGIALAVLLLLCCVLLCCVIRKRTASANKSKPAGGAAGRKEKPGPAGGTEVESGDAGGKLVHFDGPFVFMADDLLCATAEIMGKSTYGTVYKATLEDGNEVAVKRLREKIAKGPREFETEVSVLGKIRHPNLLALRAYYLGPKGEKLLVFDFMPKGSLAAFLHARGPDTPIDWPTRMNIAMGAARGLNYLHNEMNMIHGNLTSANVLLDDNTNAEISDYGLSRLMTASANSNVVATAGALGYRAPELSKLKKASTKTDVYSLGVIVLELLTGKSPGEPMNGVDLPKWVASIVKEEWTNEVFDLELMRDAAGTTGDELLNTLKLALHCVDPSPGGRPEAGQVLRQLEEIKPELAAGAASRTSTSEEGTAAAAAAAAAGPSETTD